MSLRKIESIIDAVRQERYRWTPTRRVSIEKKELDEETPTFDAHMVGQTASRGHSTDLGKLL
jgi:hypothetical protein